MIQDRYQKLLDELSISFNNLEILDLAFVHKSYLNEHRSKKKGHNERLEFLGDAVLELVVTEFLYKTYPQQEEGTLTNWRSALVKGRHLAEVAATLKLGLYLYLSKGEERSGGRKKNYLLANTLEALIGAIYLDQGYQMAHQFIADHIITKLKKILASGAHIDAKSRLQELAQDHENITPTYHLISDSGPDHDKTFVMGVQFGDRTIAEGTGSSKQKAELAAAEAALKTLNWSEQSKAGTST